jgi:hypothetical protein
VSKGSCGWIIERTLAWLSKFRCLTVRYERRADIQQAFLQLGSAPFRLLCRRLVNASGTGGSATVTCSYHVQTRSAKPGFSIA